MAAPARTVKSFTTKLNSTHPTFLAPSTQKLHSTFVVAIMGANRNIGTTTAKAFAQAGATGLSITANASSSAVPGTKKEIEAAASSSSLKVTVFAAYIADPLLCKARRGRHCILIRRS